MMGGGKILFKDADTQREFALIDPKLRFLTFVYAALAWLLYGDAIVITSIIRLGDKGSLHYWKRALDIAILENGGVAGSEFLRGIINARYPYGLKNDGTAGETVPELRHGTAPHTHLQCKKESQAWKNTLFMG